MNQTKTRFTLEDINRIKTKGFDVKLSSTTVEMVNKLAKLVGSPEYVRTPNFKNKQRNEDGDIPRRGERYYNNDKITSGGVTDADWEALKNYKVTQTIPKDRTEADQLKRDIVTVLRKITSANYEEQKTQIIEYISKVEDDDFQKVADEIFVICTSNKFYADVYVKLYKALIEKNNIFMTILNNTKNNYLNEFSNIKSVDSKKDYDLFCEINKQNETRVALSVFLTKILPKLDVETIIESLLKNVYNEFKKKDNVFVVEQYVENIYMMVQTYNKEYGAFENENITSTIMNVAMLQPRSIPSVTNKIIFKFMDLEELLEE